MNIIGVIAEFNPMHKGHIHFIEECKRLLNTDGIVCALSGNFVQRGEPALIDKWSRTKIALKSGVDLVLELPVIYSLSSAEIFAYGGISLLNSLNVINYLCFGSESGNLDIIEKIVNVLIREPSSYKNLLKENLNKGYSFPLSRGNALIHHFKDYYDSETIDSIINVIDKSNNILGIEYCKNLKLLNSNIKPYTINRIGSDYNNVQFNTEFPSASCIRKYLLNNGNLDSIKHYLPNSCYSELKKLLSNKNISYGNKMFNYLKYKIYTYPNNLKYIIDAKEGIHNKIQNEITKSRSYEELISNVKSKRYTYTRISRILTQYYIGFENYNINRLVKHPCPYVRVLGLNKTGAKILKQIKSNTALPIYTKLPKIKNEVLQLDIQATNAYSMINNSISYNSDFLNSPIIVE